MNDVTHELKIKQVDSSINLLVHYSVKKQRNKEKKEKK